MRIVRRFLTPSICLGTMLWLINSPTDGYAEMSGEWERSVTLGFNQTRGNSDTLLHRFAARGEQIAEKHEWLIDLEWTYGESDKEKNNEFGRAGIEYKQMLNRRFYADAMLEFTYDAVKDLDYRVIVGPALGYFILRDETFRLSVEAGPSYVAQRQGGVSEDFIALRFAENFSYRINKQVRVWQGTEYIPRIDDFEQYLLNSEVGVESAISNVMSLGISLEHRYDNQPAEGAKRNDLFLVSTLKYTF